MARELEEIQESILTHKAATDSLSPLEVLTNREQNTLNGLTSTSKVALWRLWVYIVALAHFTIETLFDTFKIQIQSLIDLNQIHTSIWYRERVLEYQHGFPFEQATGSYNNVGVDTGLVNASLIISSASVEELAGRLKIKVAKTENNALAPLSPEELLGLSVYLEKVKDAGNRLLIISRNPDELQLNLDISFDPLVLDGNGARLDGTNDDPIGEAIDDYLSNLEFNGEFIVRNLEDRLEAVEGVVIADTQSSSARFGTNLFQEIDKTYISDAGYMILDKENSNIILEPRGL